MTRRLILIAFATLLLAAGVGMWLAMPAPTQITMENASRIKKGMTLAEVEAILGGPARNELGEKATYRGGVGGFHDWYVFEGALWRRVYSWGVTPMDRMGKAGVSQSRWISKRCSLRVGFDKQREVVQVVALPAESTTEYGLFFLKK